MHADRLLLLADRLATRPPEFKSMCGWAGCAMGVACGMPEFRKLGLRRSRKDKWPIINDGDKPRFGLDAAEVLFGIRGLEAMRLFAPQYYGRYQRNDPVAVAERIRAFVAAHAPPGG